MILMEHWHSLLLLSLLLCTINRGIGTGGRCLASILQGPAELLEVTTGGHAVFSCTALGWEDPRNQSSQEPCERIFDDGRLNPVILFWEIEGLGLEFSTLDNDNRPVKLTINGIEMPHKAPLTLQVEIENRGLNISTNCPRELNFDAYRQASENRLNTEPPDFCLSELSCNGTITIPANRTTNETSVRCGVYSMACNGGDVTELENDQISYSSTSGRLLVRESLLSISVYQNATIQGVCFECTFTQDTTASGCQLTISSQEHNNTVSNGTYIDGMAMECVSSLIAGNYTVEAVEIDADGIVGSQAIVQLFEVFNMEESLNATATINIVVIGLSVAGNLLTVITLLIVIVLCCVLVKWQYKQPKAAGQASTSTEIGYPNHTISRESVYNAPCSTHSYDYLTVQNTELESSYDSYIPDNTGNGSQEPSYLVVLPDHNDNIASTCYNGTDNIPTTRCIAYNGLVEDEIQF